ncbi:MAG: hypothetical protein KAI72_02855, partial [Candidatus Pacebacteria bacterium]|nr:hypothetical protein [Candidatus Paceibacterota bacterium]
MDFNGGSPVALTNSPMSSFEASASICDTAGNLLFFTNAGPHFAFQDTVTGVWNRNLQLMPNGNLDSIHGGCYSASQGALIVPNPANPDQYYLFTMDCQENGHVGGFRYSIIDMTLDGGLGDITVKAIQLSDSSNEKMCGIRHANGTDFWVVMHKGWTNSYLAYQITSAGIQLPVVSSLGAPNNQWSGGSLKANKCCDKICHSTAPVQTMIFDFDNNTGVLSNVIQLSEISSDTEFSANCRFLYVNNHGTKMMIQYDMNAANIATSGVVIDDSLALGDATAHMALGPDGKIYRAKAWIFLDVINDPDSVYPVCNLQKDAFDLLGRSSSYSLPTTLINGLHGPCAPNP